MRESASRMKASVWLMVADVPLLSRFFSATFVAISLKKENHRKTHEKWSFIRLAAVYFHFDSSW